MRRDENIIIAFENNDVDLVPILWEFGDTNDFYSTSDIKEFKLLIEKHLPKIILLNVDIEYKIYDLIDFIRDKFNNKCSIIAVSSSEEKEEEFLKLKINDFILKPYKSYLVKLRVETQIKMINYIEEIEMLSITDNLTKISNRRGFEIESNVILKNAIRKSEPIAVMICDIDKFKNFNDTYGHHVGDIVLYEFANLLKSNVRNCDVVARWGGEEFVIVFSNLDFSNSLKVSENLRRLVEFYNIILEDGRELNVTASFGVHSKIPSSKDTISSFVEMADKFLYEAKENGRNQVCIG